jgi:hypothetical protein
MQGRLPQELRLAGITELQQANEFLRTHYIGEFNRKFQAQAAEKGTAFRRTSRTDLDWIFTLQTERVVDKDNTVAIAERSWQIEKHRFRTTLAGCTVIIHAHLDGIVSIRYGPHVVGRYHADGQVLTNGGKKAANGELWKSRGRGNRGKPTPGFPPFPPPLGNPAKAAGFPLSHSFGDGYIYQKEKQKTPFGKPKGNIRSDSVKPDRSRVNKSGQIDRLPTASLPSSVLPSSPGVRS